MRPVRASRIAINEVSTFGWTFEEDVVRYNRQGYQAIGIWRSKLTDLPLDYACDLLSEYGMHVSSLYWAGGFTGGDHRTYSEAMIDAYDAVMQAAALKAECLVVFTGGRRAHTRNHMRRIIKEALLNLSEAAEAVSVQLAIEPMHVGCCSEWTFLNDVPETLDLIMELDRPNIGLVFDCYHMAQNADAIHWVPSIAKYVNLVQISDARAAPLGEQNRCLPGDGSLPLEEIIRVFEQNHYDGMYEIEILGADVEHLDYITILDNAARTLTGWLAPTNS